MKRIEAATINDEKERSRALRRLVTKSDLEGGLPPQRRKKASERRCSGSPTGVDEW